MATLTLPPALDAHSPALADAAAELVERDGCAIVRGVLSADQCAVLRDEVDRVEAEHNIDVGTNEFEGHHTRRIFDLIGKSELFRELTTNDVVLPVCEAILGDDLLLSGTTSMHIGPHETPQLLHSDDGMITLPRPHPATMVTTLWALSDFRSDNGATHVVPGSHRFETTPKAGEAHDVAHAEMPAGSVLVLHGSTWHGGGHNTTAHDERYGLSVQYVAGWCRQQQNLMLGTPTEIAASYPRRLQELIGYSMFRKVMGHVNRDHPLRLLGTDVEMETVWDELKR